MSPPAGTSLFMRFFGLAENMPLYLMVGIACGLAAYTPVRHLATATDIATKRDQRDIGVYEERNLGDTLKRSSWYESGILGAVGAIKSWPEVLPLTSSVPKEHFHYQRWPKPRNMEMPEVPQ